MVIKLKNIQSFEEARFDLPDTGLIQIIGDNSNGKTILGKVLKAIMTMEFVHQEARDPLIRDGCMEGFVGIGYKGKALTINLNRDRNLCYVALMREDGEKIVRTIRDGGIEALFYEFGFRVYGKNSILLQCHETLGVIPFVNTSKALNYEIVDAVSSDTVAKQFITNYKEITYKVAKQKLTDYYTKIDGTKRVLESLPLYAYHDYTELANKAEEAAQVLSYLSPIELEDMVVPPSISILDIERIELESMIVPPELSIVEVEPVKLEQMIVPPTGVELLYNPICLEEMASILENITEASAGRCPTCGRPIDNCGGDLECVHE